MCACRLFLIEKARSASIIGILVGTLAVSGLAQALTQLRRLTHLAGKKSYTVLVGKPNPHKLANFPEVRDMLC
jgi:diphthamide biosynthesis protein 2